MSNPPVPPARRRRRAVWLLASLAAAIPAAPQTEERPAGDLQMVVHLPSAPVENARLIAEAATDLAAHLRATVPDLAVEARIFRRWEDADAYLRARAEVVAVLVSDAALLPHLPPGLDVVPSHRFSLRGARTYRRLIVTAVREVERLTDLRGRSLAVANTSGREQTAFLEAAVFAGKIAPAEWFEIRVVEDDLLAAASAIFGDTAAAVVADFNPQVRAQLGTGLREVYRSPALSMPVIAVGRRAFSATQAAAVAGALDALAETEAGARALGALRFDAAVRLTIAEQQALVLPPAPPTKALEVALPPPGALPPPEAPLFDGAELGLLLEIALPEGPSVDGASGRP